MADTQEILLTIKVRKDHAAQDIQNIKQELGKIGITGNDVSESYSKSMDRMRISTSGLRRTLGAIRNQLLVFAFAITTIKSALSFATEARNVARDGAEIDSKFSVVFGNLKKGVDEWVSSFGASVGRASQDIKAWLSTLQDTFYPLGFTREAAAGLSKDLVKLAVDVASFNNKMDEDVIRDFTSALVGNHETVRKYGILISENSIKQEAINSGLNKTYEQLTDLEKVQMRYNIILNSTKDAQGDAIRTAETDANLTKRRLAAKKDLYEHIGQKLLPISIAYNKTVIGIYENLMPVKDQIHKINTAIADMVKQGENLDNLIKEYENLKSKTELSADEQARLKIVIQEIAEITPGAITQINKYGEALEINATQAKLLYDAELRLLRLEQEKQIKKAINAYEKQKNIMKESSDKVNDARESVLKYEIQIKSLHERLVQLRQLPADSYLKSNLLRELAAAEYNYLHAMQDVNHAQLEHNATVANSTNLMNGYLIELAQYFDIKKDAKELGQIIAAEFGLDLIKAENLAIALRNLFNVIKTEKPEGGQIIPEISGPSQEIKTEKPEGGQIIPEISGPSQEIDVAKILAGYYDAMKWLDDDYYDYRVSLINAEIEDMRKAGIDEVKIVAYRNNEIKKLNGEMIDEYSSDLEKFIKEREAENEEAAQRLAHKISVLSNMLGNILYEAMGGAFENIEEMFVNMMKRMIAQAIALLAISALFGEKLSFFDALKKAVGLKTGGQVINYGGGHVEVVRNAPEFQAGVKEYIVPPGFPDDSFPILVQTGERVTVTPADQVEKEKRIAENIPRFQAGTDDYKRLRFPIDFFPTLEAEQKNIRINPAADIGNIPAVYEKIISPVNYYSNYNTFSDQQIVNILQKMLSVNEDMLSVNEDMLSVNKDIEKKNLSVSITDERPLLGNLSKEDKRKLSYVVDEGREFRIK